MKSKLFEFWKFQCIRISGGHCDIPEFLTGLSEINVLEILMHLNFGNFDISEFPLEISEFLMYQNFENSDRNSDILEF